MTGTQRQQRPQLPYQYGDHKSWDRFQRPRAVEEKYRRDVAAWDAKWGPEVAAEAQARQAERHRVAGLVVLLLAGVGFLAKAQMWGLVQ